jgi:hypothetical protein
VGSVRFGNILSKTKEELVVSIVEVPAKAGEPGAITLVVGVMAGDDGAIILVVGVIDESTLYCLYSGKSLSTVLKSMRLVNIPGPPLTTSKN